jgi:repressor of nif and glnA expression
LVLEVLADDGEPMSAAQVVGEIRERFGETVVHATVMHVLRRSKEARAGLIVQTGPGRYRAK